MTRTIEQLLASSDVLSGEEAAKLNRFCAHVGTITDRDLKDPYGVVLEFGDLTAFREHFRSRVRHFDGKRAEAAHELFELKWGPQGYPIYVVLLFHTMLHPERRQQYIAITKWLVDKARVPVDGIDISGKTALMFSFSTKPVLDFEFAQLMLDARGDINRRDRCGAVVAHWISMPPRSCPADGHHIASLALQWFLEHGGDIDIEDGDGFTGRRILEKHQHHWPGQKSLKSVVDKFELEKSKSSIPAEATPTSRGKPCPCGSGHKFKKCCGKE